MAEYDDESDDARRRDGYLRQSTRSSLIQMTACLNGIKTTGALLLLGTNFSEIHIKMQNFLFKKILFEVSSAKWRPFASMC